MRGTERSSKRRKAKTASEKEYLGWLKEKQHKHARVPDWTRVVVDCPIIGQKNSTHDYSTCHSLYILFPEQKLDHWKYTEVNDNAEGGECVSGSTDLALKSARIVDFCGKSSGIVDFENTVDRGSAVIFDAN